MLTQRKKAELDNPIPFLFLPYFRNLKAINTLRRRGFITITYIIFDQRCLNASFWLCLVVFFSFIVGQKKIKNRIKNSFIMTKIPIL